MTSPTFLSRLDDLAERFGDRCHPIVVREMRQALNSQGFGVAFALLILLCWGSSLLGVLSSGGGIGIHEQGLDFFRVFFGALTFALCFVVPAMLFNNVVAEFDGQTFEMLAITMLSPRSIVFGKLKSASVQMLAFFSAVAPFVCFTYLLEGVSLLGIGMSMLVAYLGGLSSCMGAMMLGALGKQSAWRILSMMLAVVLAIIVYTITTGLGIAFASDAGPMTFGGLCGGGACFAYGFVFYSFLTVGVTIAQFTPTYPRISQRRIPPRPANQRRSPDPPSGVS